MGNRKNILICCSNRLLRETVARVVSKKTDFRVAFLDPTAHRFKRDFVEVSADVVILDSIEPLREMPNAGPSVGRPRRCLLVAMEDDQRTFLTAVRLGALGYVLEDASAMEVVSAIRSVAEGDAMCPARYVRLLYDYLLVHSTSSPTSRVRSRTGLTRREQQLLPLIERGLTNKEIALHLNLSEQTVKNHVHRILQKVGVGDRLSVGEAVQTQSLGI